MIFLCPLLVHLGIHINISKSELGLTQHFCFLGLCWDTMNMPVPLLSENLLEIQQLAHSLLQIQPVSVHQVMSFCVWVCEGICTTSLIVSYHS